MASEQQIGVNIPTGLFGRLAWSGLVLFAASAAGAEPRAATHGRAVDPALAEAAAVTSPWARMPIAPGKPVSTRPFPPRAGRNRCINVNTVAGAQLFGDYAIELTMRDGQRYRMFFARECPSLSFYQGFYYRRQRTGQLCAGRDVVGSRAGGECAIASILPVRRIGS